MTLERYLSLEKAKSKLTQEQFADRVGISQSFLCKLAGGSSKPNPALIGKIERETGGLVQSGDWSLVRKRPIKHRGTIRRKRVRVADF